MEIPKPPQIFYYYSIIPFESPPFFFLMPNLKLPCCILSPVYHTYSDPIHSILLCDCVPLSFLIQSQAPHLSEPFIVNNFFPRFLVILTVSSLTGPLLSLNTVPKTECVIPADALQL